MSTIMPVVAAALADADGRWLLQKRPAGKRHAGLWEFPGGKVEGGETPRAALVRELNEELTIRIEASAPVRVGEARAPAGEGEPGIVITLYTLADWEGVPVAEPGAELGWFTFSEAEQLPLPPLDRTLLAQLRRHAG